MTEHTNERPKRLEPTKDTIRHLFAHSGNNCAFEGCERHLIDDLDNFVGEVCHIEAAEPGGERFNADMSNEDRRHQDNLVLLCHEHHVRTNAVAIYPVPMMRTIKSKHEAKFAAQGLSFGVSEVALEQIVDQLSARTIFDVTDTNQVSYPVTMVRLFTMAYDEEDTRDDEQRAADLTIVYPVLDNLRRLPVDTRGIFQIIVSRADEQGHDFSVDTDEIVLVSTASPEDVYSHLRLLETYSLITLWNDDGIDRIATRGVGPDQRGDWPFWRDVRRFCDKTRTPVEDLLMGFRFDLLD